VLIPPAAPSSPTASSSPPGNPWIRSNRATIRLQ
jgi:hypothetical protein